MRCWMLLPIISLLLTGCATDNSETVTCPALKSYSAADQKQALTELSGLPHGSELGLMMDDYGDLRAQVRACNKAAN